MLVALGSGKPSRVLEFNAYLDVPPTAEEPENHPTAAVEVVFEETGPKTTTERLPPHDMLFTFEPVRQVFQEAIGRWLAFVEANRRIVTQRAAWEALLHASSPQRGTVP